VISLRPQRPFCLKLAGSFAGPQFSIIDRHQKEGKLKLHREAGDVVKFLKVKLQNASPGRIQVRKAGGPDRATTATRARQARSGGPWGAKAKQTGRIEPA
jgi:hypothetical protein